MLFLASTLATIPEFFINGLFEYYLSEKHPKNIFIISNALTAIPGRGIYKITEILDKDQSNESG